LPEGIAKANGRLEATQVDVSSKYAGRLEEVTVEEGASVTQGQAIAKLTSPEYEAQLRAAKADVQKANAALASAEAEITSRQSALEFAKSDFERGQELMKTGFITKQVFEQRKRNFDSAVAAVQNFTSQRDQALSQIANSEAEVDRVQSIIDDLTLVSTRIGRVQYQLARAGEVVAGRRADCHHPRPYRRLHDRLPPRRGRGPAGGRRRGPHYPRSGTRLRYSGKSQLCRGRRAIHP
jgi:HlyD family secretion protein